MYLFCEEKAHKAKKTPKTPKTPKKTDKKNKHPTQQQSIILHKTNLKRYYTT